MKLSLLNVRTQRESCLLTTPKLPHEVTIIVRYPTRSDGVVGSHGTLQASGQVLSVRTGQKQIRARSGRRLPDSHRDGPTLQDSYTPGLIDSYRPDPAHHQPEEAEVKGEPNEGRSWLIDVRGSSVQYKNTSSSYDQPHRRATEPVQALSQAVASVHSAQTDRPVALPISSKRLKHLGVLEEKKSKLEDDIIKAIATGADEQSHAITGSRRTLSALMRELQTAQQGVHLEQTSTSKVQSQSLPRRAKGRRQNVKQRIGNLEKSILKATDKPQTVAIERSKRLLAVLEKTLQQAEKGKKIAAIPKLRTPKQRYEQVRKAEQLQSLKNLTGSRGKQKMLQSRLSAAQRSLLKSNPKHSVAPLGSDDEEDGGVRLTHRLDQQHSALLIQANDAEQELHVCEVDYFYCTNSPMNQPYICLFGYFEHGQNIDSKQNQRTNSEISSIFMEIEHEAGIIRTTTGEKPPFWYEIEERIRSGTLQEKPASELNSMNQMQMPVIGGKVDAVERSMDGMSLKRKHDWIEEEQIPAEILDSEDDEDDEEDDDENNE